MQEKLVVIYAIWGQDLRRAEAFASAYRHLQEQTVKAKFVLIELLFSEQKSMVPGDIRETCSYVPLQGKTRNQDLWQKENLYNIAAKHANDDDVLLFLDTDMYSPNPTWFELILRMVRNDEMRMIQPFFDVKDTKNPEFHWFSIANRHTDKNEWRLRLNPGAAWAMSKRMFNQLGGFNPYCLDGSGDALTVIEAFWYDEFWPIFRPRYFLHKPWMKDIYRQLDIKPTYDFIQETLVHVNHGDDRNYTSRENLLALFKNEVKQILKVDEQGLLSWKDENCVERRILRREILRMSKDVKPAPFLPLFTELVKANGIRDNYPRYQRVDDTRMVFAEFRDPHIFGCAQIGFGNQEMEIVVAGEASVCTLGRFFGEMAREQRLTLRMEIRSSSLFTVETAVYYTNAPNLEAKDLFMHGGVENIPAKTLIMTSDLGEFEARKQLATVDLQMPDSGQLFCVLTFTSKTKEHFEEIVVSQLDLEPL